MRTGTVAPDSLSEWTEPPPVARASGDADPIRCFDTAEEALRCLANLDDRRERPGRRLAVQRPAARGD
jgi:hypothetical protein